jgi:hypothetical protein
MPFCSFVGLRTNYEKCIKSVIGLEESSVHYVAYFHFDIFTFGNPTCSPTRFFFTSPNVFRRLLVLRLQRSMSSFASSNNQVTIYDEPSRGSWFLYTICGSFTLNYLDESLPVVALSCFGTGGSCLLVSLVVKSWLQTETSNRASAAMTRLFAFKSLPYPLDLVFTFIPCLST